MFSSVEWFIAWRYLRARRRDGFVSVIAGISLIGICLGVAVLIVVMSVMNGFRQELLTKILGVNGHATLYGYSGEITDHVRLVKELSAVDGVKSAVAIIDGQALASSRGANSGVLIRGVAPEGLAGQGIPESAIKTGSMKDFGGEGKVLIGDALAGRLGLKVGDDLTLISPKGHATPFGIAPRIQSFEIVATFELGVYQYDDAFVFMNIPDAQDYLLLGSKITAIEMKLDDPEKVEAILPHLQKVAGQAGVLSDWRSMNASLVSALNVERNVMFLILTLIILIASVNIVSSLIILVKDKSRDIAVLRTLGATQGSVMRAFMIAGTSVGVIGTFLGFLLGVLCAKNVDKIRIFFETILDTQLWNPEIRFLTEMPSLLQWDEVLLTVGISLVISILATIPPARRAARTDPVQVLRYE